MFRHTNKQANQDIPDKKLATEDQKSPILEVTGVKEYSKADTQILKELLEKNLKWSQIIYEQNRKINNKLMWAAIGGWLRLVLILAPLIWAVWFLPPLVNKFMKNYGNLLGVKTDLTQSVPSGSLEQIMKLLPLDPAKQEQLKSLLK